MSYAYIKNLLAVDYESSSGVKREILDHAKQQVGFIPNMYANMANVPEVLNNYLHGYDLFRKKSQFSSTEQEVVFLAISQVNGCTYCTAAHSMIADKFSGVTPEVLKAIRENSPIPDQKLAALYALTQDIIKTHGKPKAELVQLFTAAGYSELDILYIILASAVKTLSNYSNIAFGTQVDEAFEPYKIA